MEAFDASMFPHEVYILPLSETTDAASGLVESFPSTSGLTPVPCRVRLKQTMAGFSGNVEIGMTEADVAFPTAPSITKGDRLQRVSDGLKLRVLGTPKDRAFGFNFVAACRVID